MVWSSKKRANGRLKNSSSYLVRLRLRRNPIQLPRTRRRGGDQLPSIDPWELTPVRSLMKISAITSPKRMSVNVSPVSNREGSEGGEMNLGYPLRGAHLDQVEQLRQIIEFDHALVR